MAGNYAALFSKQDIKFKTPGMNNLIMKEDDCRSFIIEEYTITCVQFFFFIA
jgi:hypothetical protein